uniref:GH16 domain-containing protein n=1 Tax=Aegilops tauschii subsp. strangulata TaxID=200361 RepID=A0A453SX64_AEGTS
MGQARAYLLASLAAFYLVALATPQVAADMTDEVNLLWGKCNVLRDGAGRQTVAMSLDRSTTSGFSSKIKYLFGRIDMEIKLVPGNSAGTVTTFYVSDGLINAVHVNLSILRLTILHCNLGIDDVRGTMAIP